MDQQRAYAAMRTAAVRKVTFTNAIAVALAATLLSNISVALAEGSAFFGHVGLYRVTSGNQSYAIATLQSCNKDHCCMLCAVREACVGVNYHGSSRQCILLRMVKWQLESNSSYTLFVRGAALSRQEKREYRSFSGVLSNGARTASIGNYSLPMAENDTCCQNFCELLAYNCYAYQFHSGLRRCEVFTGYYTGGYLPLDTTESGWSLSFPLRAAGGMYRKLPGAYPLPYGFTPLYESNVVDALDCRQRCEKNSSNCSLFAYNSRQMLCSYFSGDVPPAALLFNLTAADWTAFYRFRQDSSARECSNNYYFVKKNLWRDDAQQHCISVYGAQLTTIDSPDEQRFLMRLINTTAGLANNKFWIGAKSDSYPYNFRWACGGANLAYSAWHPGEPNFSNEYCVHLWEDLSWNNAACTAISCYFICEDCLGTACS